MSHGKYCKITKFIRENRAVKKCKFLHTKRGEDDIRWDKLFFMGSLANNIYKNNIFIDNIEGNFDNIYINDNVSTPFAIVSDSKKDDIYVVFKGTKNISNWLTNFNIKLSDTELFNGADVQVHKGFLLAYKNIREDLFTLLNNNISNCLKVNNECNLFVIGHSLGGSLAQLLCADNKMHTDAFKSVFCITFGSPRLGNLKFARHLNKKMHNGKNLYRFQCSNDIVTRVPLFFGYKHAGRPYYFDRKGRLYRKINLLKLIINQVIDRIVDGHFLAGIRDHNMHQYLCALCKQVNNKSLICKFNIQHLL